MPATKWKYLIVDLFEGAVFGTNDDEGAKALADVDEFFVINAEDQTWMTAGESADVIPELRVDREPPADEDTPF